MRRLGDTLDDPTDWPLAVDDPAYCAICGRPMGESIDDQPHWPTGPMCGECYQSRQLDDELAWSDEA